MLKVAIEWGILQNNMAPGLGARRMTKSFLSHVQFPINIVQTQSMRAESKWPVVD